MEKARENAQTTGTLARAPEIASPKIKQANGAEIVRRSAVKARDDLPKTQYRLGFPATSLSHAIPY
ncbi:hypothetical protein PanNE5_25680 [Pandoraea sp. NE5]|nr:hypothetical protein PanNE5_25680 [Pandoraea sp. NE5]